LYRNGLSWCNKDHLEEEGYQADQRGNESREGSDGGMGEATGGMQLSYITGRHCAAREG